VLEVSFQYFKFQQFELTHCKNSMAMALRRSNMLRYSNWTADCIQMLENSGIPSDVQLSGWCKLQNTAEESVMALGLDDHHSRADLGDVRIQSILRALNKQINQWKEKTNWLDINGA
jgi:hypothetical protein